jgi:putative flippase GtrA
MLRKIFVHPTSHVLVQLFRYGLVVAVAFPVDFGLLYVFTEHFHIYYLASAIMSFTISMIVNFLISVLWVFRLRTDRPLWKEIVAFFIIGFVGLGLTALIVWFFTTVLGVYYLISKLIAVSFVFFWSFGARRLMFNKHVSDYIILLKRRFTND